MANTATLEDFPNYSISDDGTVIRKAHTTKKGIRLKLKMVKPVKMANGYYMVTLTNRQGEAKTIYLHRLIWQAFNHEIPMGMEIDHIDTNRANNQLSNLRMLSHSSNCNNPISLEKYKKANALEKNKYDRRRLNKARSAEYLESVIRIYFYLFNRCGEVKVLRFMEKAHIGFYRAKRIITELTVKNEELN